MDFHSEPCDLRGGESRLSRSRSCSIPVGVTEAHTSTTNCFEMPVSLEFSASFSSIYGNGFSLCLLDLRDASSFSAQPGGLLRNPTILAADCSRIDKHVARRLQKTNSITHTPPRDSVRTHFTQPASLRTPTACAGEWRSCAVLASGDSRGPYDFAQPIPTLGHQNS